MIYSIFIKKTKGDKKPFGVARIVKNFLSYNSNLFLLGWPGYISKSKEKIDDFKNEIVPSNTNISGYFLNPLNGSTQIIHPKTKSSVRAIDYMNELFGSNTCSNKMVDDHSKILAFLEIENINKSISDSDITQILNNGNFEVKALMVGSSNQSENTYCKSPTPKGEADVFMVDIEEKQENEILSKILDIEDENKKNIFFEQSNILVSKELEKFNNKFTLKDVVINLLKDIL